MQNKLINTKSPAAIIIIRFIVGIVFFTEGIQKFLFPEQLGIGRFTKIGIPYPDFFAPFIGVVEIVFPLFLFIGFLSRFATIPLIIDICVAIITTKIPMLIHKGFWVAMHESRVDLCMLFGLIFLIISGAGRWSVDNLLTSKHKNHDSLATFKSNLKQDEKT